MAEGKDDRPGVDEAPGAASEERPSNDREALEGTLAAAREEARQNHDRWLRAVAEVSRRASTMCFCRVEVADEDGRPVAEGLVTYRLG